MNNLSQAFGMKHIYFLCLLLLPFWGYGQGTLLKGKLKLNKKDLTLKLKGIKLLTDFQEGTLWIYYDVDRGAAQNWLINSEPWGSIRFQEDGQGNYFGRAEMGQNFVEFESWRDTVSNESNWVIKSLSDVYFLRRKKEATSEDFSLLKQIVTPKGRAEVHLIDFSYDKDDPKNLYIIDEAPLSDYPLLMKVVAAWLATLEGLEQLTFLPSEN